MQTLFNAIYARFTTLKAASAIGDATDMYNTEAPSDAVFPYIVFSLVSDVQDFDSDSLFEDTLIQFNIFSDNSSTIQVCEIFKALKGVTIEGTGYDFFQLVVDDYNTLQLKRDNSNLTKVKKVWQYNVTYLCLLDYTGEVAVEKFYGNLYALMNI